MSVRYAPTAELALGANLLADPSTWVWTDVTRYLMKASSITITRGRGDGYSAAGPAQCSLTLINDGRFVPRNPNGAYYGTIARNTPLRVKISGSNRFLGYVDEWPTTWADASARTSFAPITASGLLRRIDRSAVLQSAMYRSTVGSAPIAYWPMEDAAGSQQCVSALSGGSPLTGLGNIRFGTTAGPAGSKSQPDFTLGGSMRGPVPASAATRFRAEVSALVNPQTTGNIAIPLDVYSGGGVQTWEIVVRAAVDGTTYIQYTFSDGSTGVISSGVATDDGVWHHYRLDVAKSGSDTTYALYIDGNLTSAAGTHVGVAFGGVTSVVVAPRALAAQNPNSAGHVTVWDAVPAVDTYQVFTGWAGESATNRLIRLGTENAIPVNYAGAPSTTLMGPQQSTSLLQLLRDIETSDQGVIYDGLDGRLYLRTSAGRYNGAVGLTLNVTAGQLGWPFAGTDDDQQLINDVTVSGPTGSSAHYAATTGANTPAAVGTYATTVSANVAADAQLAPLAQWRVHLGVVEDLRYPLLTLDLTGSPELITAWLSCDVGTRIAVTHISRLTQLPADDLDLHLEGYTERIDSMAWTVTLNTSPARPWQAFVLDATGNAGRLDSAGSTLNTSINAVTSSVSVATPTGPVWQGGTVSFDINLDGERMTVTFVTGASSPQTFTVTRGVNGAAKAHTAGATVSLWRAGVIAL